MERNSNYENYPELSRYSSTDRFGEPKEDFKTIIRKLKSLDLPASNLRVADIGCANGELLYYLRNEFPDWDLFGFDIEETYLETARSVDELTDVTFVEKNLFDITKTFDVLLSSCFLLLFQDIEPPLKKMIDRCGEDGYIVSTGLFNPYGIDVRVEYRDNNHEETKGTWRTDYNRHSQRTVRSLIDGQVSSIEFEPCPFQVDIEKDPEHPLRVWTVEDVEGNRIIRNGAGQILNQTLMTVRT